MHEVKQKRALPVYIAAGVFALYALIFPLYSLWHFLLAALVTAAAWLAADKLIRPVTAYEPDPVAPASAEEVAARVLAQGAEADPATDKAEPQTAEEIAEAEKAIAYDTAEQAMLHSLDTEE